MADTKAPAAGRTPPARSAPTTPPADGAANPASPAAPDASAHDQQHEQINTRLDQHSGLLQQILDRLPGKPGQVPASGEGGQSDPDAGKPIGQLVREGVEKLEADRRAKQAAAAADAERADHAHRIAALEEARPREVPATQAGRFRAGVQRWVFGLDEHGR